eukprot:TRINITY_DN1494_c3_g1_i2.p1 TRINITY_DN1494_c3_g1~~TRINITY_DN1494_c3_g1_i2.p1  ORF type:complete len:788 (-),score=182.48 TRINITY_DN1494_c3_g1_i2:186-2549(-)
MSSNKTSLSTLSQIVNNLITVNDISRCVDTLCTVTYFCRSNTLTGEGKSHVEQDDYFNQFCPPLKHFQGVGFKRKSDTLLQSAPKKNRISEESSVFGPSSVRHDRIRTINCVCGISSETTDPSALADLLCAQCSRIFHQLCLINDGISVEGKQIPDLMEEEVNASTPNGSVERKETMNSQLVINPLLHGDNMYKFVCKSCFKDWFQREQNVDERHVVQNSYYFKILPRTWKDMIEVSMFNIGINKKKIDIKENDHHRFTIDEISSFIDSYWDRLHCDTVKPLDIKKEVSVVLSSNGDSFVSCIDGWMLKDSSNNVNGETKIESRRLNTDIKLESNVVKSASKFGDNSTTTTATTTTTTTNTTTSIPSCNTHDKSTTDTTFTMTENRSSTKSQHHPTNKLKCNNNKEVPLNSSNTSTTTTTSTPTKKATNTTHTPQPVKLETTLEEKLSTIVMPRKSIDPNNNTSSSNNKKNGTTHMNQTRTPSKQKDELVTTPTKSRKLSKKGTSENSISGNTKGAKNNAKKNNNNDEGIPQNDEDDTEEFFVEDIVGKRITSDGTLQYKIKWVGYDNRYNCWVDADQMNCPEKVEEFEKRSKDPSAKVLVRTPKKAVPSPQTAQKTSTPVKLPNKVVMSMSPTNSSSPVSEESNSITTFKGYQNSSVPSSSPVQERKISSSVGTTTQRLLSILNQARKVPRVGFDVGDTIKKILGVNHPSPQLSLSGSGEGENQPLRLRDEEQMMYYVEWKKSGKRSWLPSKLLKERDPQALITYYESKIIFALLPEHEQLLYSSK